MMVGGVKATVETSHKGWKKRILEEKEWSTTPPGNVMEGVLEQERQILKEARNKSLQEYPDVDYEHMRHLIAQWGNSLGLPSDWIPRAALRTKIECIDVMVWAALSKAVRLQVRPKRWGVSRQAVIYKRGDTDVYASWRNIMINTHN